MRTTIKTRRKRIPSWDELREMFQETDRKFQETDRKFQETDKQFKETDRKFQETDRKFQETDKQFKETGKQFQKTEKMVQELATRFQETDKQIKESDLKFEKMREEIRELTTKFTSQSGHIIEGLMEPSVIKIFQERGYDMNLCWKNYKKYNKSLGKKLEVDLFLLNDEVAIIVEVKINCTDKDVDHFIEQMSHFKKVCPEYADRRIYLAMAAINYDRDSDQYAHKQGLFVIRVSNNNVFSLDSNDKDKMKIL